MVVDPPVVTTPQFSVTDGQVLPTAPSVAASNDRFLVMYLDLIGGQRRPGMMARVVSPGGALSAEVQVSPNIPSFQGLCLGIEAPDRQVQHVRDPVFQVGPDYSAKAFDVAYDSNIQIGRGVEGLTGAVLNPGLAAAKDHQHLTGAVGCFL